MNTLEENTFLCISIYFSNFAAMGRKIKKVYFEHIQNNRMKQKTQISKRRYCLWKSALIGHSDAVSEVVKINQKH